ncbi:MAG TPA: tetratricopeptide repeat protein [Candidatus Eisenbacteria bacterium]|nr:tetratricopeptide repeat protein [Candidatus Eisenbacteria bacterium]
MARQNARKGSARPAAKAGRAAETPLPSPVAWTLWGLLATLLLLRAIMVFHPSMWTWSLNLQRFLAPAWGFGLWALAAVALIPGVARRATPAWNAIGEAIAKRPGLTTSAAVLAAMLLVWLFPDRVRFTGDFLLRQGTVEVAERPSQLFPQALPLDVLLHYGVPRVLTQALAIDANGAARLLGMLEAGTLAALAMGFARTLGLVAGAAVAVAGIVFFGGYLGMFTGFSKAFAEMCLLVAAVGVFGLSAIRQGRGLLGLGLALTIGVTLHRSALGLLPAVVYAWVAWWRVHAREGAWKRSSVLVALAIPVLGLAVMVPRIIAVVRRWDAAHFDPRGAELSGSVLSAAFSGARPVDLVNLVVMLSPVSLLLASWVVLARHRAAGASREAVLLVLLALPFLLVMPFIHPAQGLFRDWDDFAATGVAISLLSAWTVAQALRASPRHALAVAITLAAMVPAVQWLAHNADVDRGFQRVRAFVLEPPPRAPRERGTTWDFLGIRNFRLERWEDAAESFAQAASTSPSPRILQEWALAETMRKQYPLAQQIYYRFLEKSPANPLGWLGLAQVSIYNGDLSEARRAAHRLLELEPGNRHALEVLARAEQMEAAARGPQAQP